MIKFIVFLSLITIAFSLTDKDMVDVYPCLKCMETVNGMKYAMQQGAQQKSLTSFGTLTYCNAFPLKCTINPQFGVFLYNEITRGTTDKEICASVCPARLIKLLDDLSKMNQQNQV